MPRHDTITKIFAEEAAYFEVPGAHLYTVIHRAADPVARVLLVGPFASERHFSYHPWVRWARYLAARQIEVLRYDYRGVGESTGKFEDITFAEWLEDTWLLADWFKSRLPHVPLILHGLEIGAILAAHAFARRLGDALLLWSPPSNANQALRASLLLWAGLEQMWESSENHPSASECRQQLERGHHIEVQGYRWSPRLWRDSFRLELPAMAMNNVDTRQASARPIKSVMLDKTAAPLVKPHLMYHALRDLTWLYAVNYDWINGTVNAN